MPESRDHITCQQVVKMVTAYLERGLSAGETSLFEQHLNFCEGCVWYVEQMRGTIEAAGRIAEDEVPAEARNRLLAAFRGWSPP
jgi:anti-sigma factor RsiW